jgi:hypothetical protein
VFAAKCCTGEKVADALKPAMQGVLDREENSMRRINDLQDLGRSNLQTYGSYCRNLVHLKGAQIGDWFKRWARLFSLQKAPTCETRKLSVFHI